VDNRKVFISGNKKLMFLKKFLKKNMGIVVWFREGYLAVPSPRGMPTPDNQQYSSGETFCIRYPYTLVKEFSEQITKFVVLYFEPFLAKTAFLVLKNRE
jgi:hypothetical protein